MIINSISTNFPGKILLWPKDLKNIKETKDQHVIHKIDDNFEKIFTTQSILQAIINDKLQVRYTTKGRRKFYIIDYKYLSESN